MSITLPQLLCGNITLHIYTCTHSIQVNLQALQAHLLSLAPHSFRPLDQCELLQRTFSNTPLNTDELPTTLLLTSHFYTYISDNPPGAWVTMDNVVEIFKYRAVYIPISCVSMVVLLNPGCFLVS